MHLFCSRYLEEIYHILGVHECTRYSFVYFDVIRVSLTENEKNGPDNMQKIIRHVYFIFQNFFFPNSRITISVSGDSIRDWL